MAGADVISHLIEIEKRAAEFTHQAYTEADARITEARSKIDSQFKQAYDELIKDLESKYQEQSQALKKNYDQDFDNYVQKIKDTHQDKEAMRSLFMSLLEKSL